MGLGMLRPRRQYSPIAVRCLAPGATQTMKLRGQIERHRIIGPSL